MKTLKPREFRVPRARKILSVGPKEMGSPKPGLGFSMCLEWVLLSTVRLTLILVALKALDPESKPRGFPGTLILVALKTLDSESKPRGFPVPGGEVGATICRVRFRVLELGFSCCKQGAVNHMVGCCAQYLRRMQNGDGGCRIACVAAMQKAGTRFWVCLTRQHFSGIMVGKLQLWEEESPGGGVEASQDVGCEEGEEEEREGEEESRSRGWGRRERERMELRPAHACLG